MWPHFVVKRTMSALYELSLFRTRDLLVITGDNTFDRIDNSIDAQVEG